MDYKAFAKAMRENAVTNEYEQIICSPQLWEQIASIIENVAINDEFMDEKGAFHLNDTDLVAYSHGEYFNLGEKLGKFGYSVQKK